MVLILLFSLGACNFSGEESAGGAVFSGHQESTEGFQAQATSGLYVEDDIISISLSYAKVLNVAGGVPSIDLTIGASTVQATYVSGTGSDTLIFTYQVQAGDDDSDGITVNSPISLNGATIKLDEDGSDADLNFSSPDTSSLYIDTSAPSISSVNVPSDNLYYINQNLDFTVNFDESVTITGTPQLAFDIGGSIVYANYLSGSGSQNIKFRYTVLSSDIDLNGISIASPLSLNSGSIKDIAANNASLSFVPAATPNIWVNGDAPVVTSITPPTAGTYILGEDISFTLNFNESVTVTNDPSISLNIGGNSVDLDYTSGSGTNQLSFTYTALAEDFDDNGVELAQIITLNSGTIRDGSGNDAKLLIGLSASQNVLVDARVPTIVDIEAPANGYYEEDDVMDFIVEFSQEVNVTNLPLLEIEDEDSTLEAHYIAGTGSRFITFRYIVQAGDNDLDGITLNSPINANISGTIKNDLGVNADFTFVAPNTSSIRIDTIIPSIVSITPPANNTYYETETLDFIVTFSEPVRITGSPRIPITLTSGTVYASASAATYSTTHTFSYTVGANDQDDDGIALVTPLQTNGGTIRDRVNNNSTLTYTLPNTSSIFITSVEVAITSAPDIDINNQTEYIVSGTCSEAGQVVSVDIGGLSFTPVCSGGGTWTTGQQNVSALVDGTITITADHQSSGGSSATQASVDVDKDITAPVVTISSAPNITSSNESSYTVSGTCSENTRTVSVDIGGLTFSPTCSSGSWTTGAQDVSALADGSVIITADHDNAALEPAPQASTTVSKESSTPAVQDLAAGSVLAEQIDLSWELSTPGGFVIDDYVIEYQIKDSGSWSVFADGVTTDEFATVTGLTPDTTYEFRAAVKYDTTETSEWSSIIEVTTQPDDPLFGPYAAMNVGGATTSTVTAHYDGTNITLNGGALTTLNKGEYYTFASAQFDVIDADKPIYTAGRRGNTSTGPSSANIVWNPTSWSGKTFSFNSTRDNPQVVEIYAIEDTYIEIRQGTTVLASDTVTIGNATTLSWSTYGSYQVVATGSILAYHYANSGGNYTDPKPLLPSSSEIIGFPSTSMELTTMSNGTNYTYIHSNSNTSSSSLNKTDSTTISAQGTTNLYQSESLIITADKQVSGASYADSNGNCSAPFMPTSLMKKNYIINASADYVAFASKQAGTIDIVDNTDSVVSTISLTRSGGNPNAPYKARTTITNFGYRYRSTVPMAGWYQPNTWTGAAQQDETILFGTNE